MRKTAGEVIRELQMRVARLERSANLLDHFGHSLPDIYAIEPLALDHLNFDHKNVDWNVSNVEFKRQDERSGYVEVTGRFKTKKLVTFDYDARRVTTILEEQQPFKDCHFEDYTRTSFDVKGDIYPDQGKYSNPPGMISVNFDGRDVKWVIHCPEDNRFDFELESTLKPDVDAEALASEINKRLR